MVFVLLEALLRRVSVVYDIVSWGLPRALSREHHSVKINIMF